MEPEWIVGPGVVFRDLTFEDIRVSEAPRFHALVITADNRDRNGEVDAGGWDTRVEDLRFRGYVTPPPTVGATALVVRGNVGDVVFEGCRCGEADLATIEPGTVIEQG